MNKKFFIAGVVTSAVHLLMHVLAYVLLLKDLYERYPAIPEGIPGQWERMPGRLVPWGLAVSSLAFGFFITLLMSHTGARTFLAGLKTGFAPALLFWSSINFGLYASSYMFSSVSLFADLACSTTIMTVACAVSARVLGSGANRLKTINL